MDQNSKWAKDSIWPRWERNHPIFWDQIWTHAHMAHQHTSIPFAKFSTPVNVKTLPKPWPGLDRRIAYRTQIHTCRPVLWCVCLPAIKLLHREVVFDVDHKPLTLVGASFAAHNEGTVERVWSIASSPGSSFDVRIHLDQRQIALDLVASPTLVYFYHWVLALFPMLSEKLEELRCASTSCSPC